MGINTSNAVDSLPTASPVSSIGSPSTSKTSDARATSDVAASADISKPAELLNKLQQLQEQDPTKFKRVMSDIAGKLRTAANSASGDAGAAMTKIADTFEQAGKTGDLSGLQPPPPPTAGHAKPPATKYLASSGSAVSNALLETTETPAQTAKEAAAGDVQAQRLVARQAAAAKHHHHGTGAMHGLMPKIMDEVNQALSSTARTTTTSSSSKA